MAQKGTTVCHTDFPLYAVRAVGDKYFMVAGGGGRAKTGISNSIELFEIKNVNGKCIVRHCNKFDTAEKATMNCDVWKVDNTYTIAAGQDDGCQLYTLMSKIQALRSSSADATTSDGTGIRKRKSNLTQSETYGHAQKSIVHSLEREQFIQTDFSDNGAFQKVVQYCPERNVLVTGGADGFIRIWKFPSLRKVFEIDAHRNEIDDLSVSPSGNMICSIGKDNKCFIWNSTNGKKEYEAKSDFRTDAKYRCRNCRYGKVVDKKGEYRLFTSHIPVVRARNAVSYITKWDTKSYERTKFVSTGDEILSAMAISDDGTYLGVGTISGSVSVYVSFNLMRLYNLKAAHSIFVTGVEFTPSTPSAMAATGGYDFTLLSISADNQVKIHQTQPTEAKSKHND